MDLWDLIFPPKCAGCGKQGSYFCPKCILTVKEVTQICPVCENPSPFGQTHSFCLTKTSPDGLFSFFVYEGVIKDAIHKLKYKFITDLEKDLWRIIKKSLFQKGEEIKVLNKFINQEKPVVVPIPLYWYKEHCRGFNQSLLIGERFAGSFRLAIMDKLLVRKKNSVSQTKLTQKEREQNVKGIFFVSPNILTSYPPNILLIDDVWTTGSTMKEAIRVLKEAGVKKVWGLTVAR